MILRTVGAFVRPESLTFPSQKPTVQGLPFLRYRKFPLLSWYGEHTPLLLRQQTIHEWSVSVEEDN